ncbi:TetR/AcrR family transcriptional regulator [Dongia sedimenti]|uniref:TetR/AcrR family transcriptional regulator n=1 Tax=Dongia sedimenti TaxID=3064282 RepID=A0ABU0YRB6_9PROT|nr:TetR/AcrR family transcriptional regulator [Rhodospirillaceae bacterium R-7]
MARSPAPKLRSKSELPGLKPEGRKPRADGERNRQRLLDAAKASFAKSGATTSLEEVARTAGVGIGTLYRHFPTRDALVEHVYRDALERLAVDAERLMKDETPLEALRQWLLLFVDYIATKKLMHDLLATLAGGAAALQAQTKPRLENAITSLVDRAKASGDIKSDVAPFDLLFAIGGLAYMGTGSEWESRGRKMVDILIAGVKRG